MDVLSAVKQNSSADYIVRVVSLSGLSLPSFWLGLLILTAFVAWAGYIPIYTNEPETWYEELGLLIVPAAYTDHRPREPWNGPPVPGLIPPKSARCTPNMKGYGFCPATTAGAFSQKDIDHGSNEAS